MDLHTQSPLLPQDEMRKLAEVGALNFIEPMRRGILIAATRCGRSTSRAAVGRYFATRRDPSVSHACTDYSG
jgi:hypothetical protein